MRFEKRKKTERNKLLREYHQSHPELALQEIGRVFSISKQRVWDIVHHRRENGEG